MSGLLKKPTFLDGVLGWRRRAAVEVVGDAKDLLDEQHDGQAEAGAGEPLAMEAGNVWHYLRSGGPLCRPLAGYLPAHDVQAVPGVCARDRYDEGGRLLGGPGESLERLEDAGMLIAGFVMRSSTCSSFR